MHGGATLPARHTEGPISVQVIDGALRVTLDSRAVLLHPGQLVTLQSSVRHGVQAATEAASLLTLSAEASHPAERPRLWGRIPTYDG
jgi:quercetin dioxygenase-like cupin family protein